MAKLLIENSLNEPFLEKNDASENSCKRTYAVVVLIAPQGSGAYASVLLGSEKLHEFGIPIRTYLCRVCLNTASDEHIRRVRSGLRTGMMTLSSSVVNAGEARSIASSWARILRARLDAAHGIGKQ